MKFWLLLVVIVLIAAATRLPFLGQFPNGLTADEIQQGYSAYSILKTGHDEWGQFLPIFPRGFGDFKPPAYTYLDIPFVGLLGLTPVAVRLPAALVGILSVVVLYFLSKELFDDEKIALWAALFLAISPWGIQISRTAFEGGLGILTFSLSLLFFLKKTQKMRILSAIFAGLTLYTYHSWRVFIVLFMAALLILFRRNLLTAKNLIPVLILLIFLLPFVFNLGPLLARSSDVGIFSQSQIEGYFSNKTASTLPPLVNKILDNKFLFGADQFFGNYLSYFSAGFFFSNNRPDSTYLNFPYFPLLYPIEFFLWLAAIFGLLTGVFTKGNPRKGWLILIWFFLAAVPASLAVGGFNANRSPTFLPLTALISALGATVLIQRFTSFKYLLVVVLASNFVIFQYFYFVKLPLEPSYNLRYGYDQVFKKVAEVQSQYDFLVISKAFSQPQILVAFYSQVDPSFFQASSQDWLRYETAHKQYVDQIESYNLGKYLFEGIDWQQKDSKRIKALIVSTPADFPTNVNSILDVKNPKGEVIYRLVPVNTK